MIWQKILETFWRIYLKIIFWILSWMLSSLVIWNLNVTVSTTLKYCYKKALNKKLKWMGEAVRFFPKQLLVHEILRSIGPWHSIVFFFEKFVKPSALSSLLLYILNVSSLHSLFGQSGFCLVLISNIKENLSLESDWKCFLHFLPGGIWSR